jgi:hypothetical protein
MRPRILGALGALTALVRVVGGPGDPQGRAIVWRCAGQDRLVDAPGLAAAFGRAPARECLAVFVPASGESESIWRRGGATTGSSYPVRVADVLGWPVLELRHRAGAGTAEAAVELSALVQAVVDGWPGRLRRIVVVAQGDGGLVVRSALGVRALAHQPWSGLVSEVITLGTPTAGTRTDAVTGGMARRADEVLAGIAVLPPEVLDAPALDHVDYLVVADSRVARPHPWGRLLGNVLWFRHRASPRGRRLVDLFPTGERFEVDGLEHPLTNHPEVHDALLRWLV